MKTIKNILISGAVAALSMVSFSSCEKSILDLAPVDYYGSGNYWTTEAQVKGYIDGLHKNMRDASWNHTMLFGELRGGQFLNGAGADGTTTSNGDIVDQKFDADHPGVTKYGNYYGYITNCNLFIARVTEMPESVISKAEKDFFLGIAHGLRAFYYFDLYRIYGKAPLRLDVAVIDGELDPLKLYMKQSPASEVLAQIKKDISESLKYFGDNKAFNPYNSGPKAYWSKAATECLAAEVYLWSAKVAVGDQPEQPGDLATAKQHCQSLLSNYGLTMLDSFAGVFDATKKGNSETIFAIRFMENEASNSNGNFLYLQDARSNTKSSAVREEVQPDGSIKVVDWGDPCNIATSSGIQYYQYLNDFFLKFDRADSRRNATFLASYQKSDWYDKGVLNLRGSHVVKNIGYINSNGVRVYCGDYIYYRLPEVYLMLAEIANYEGQYDEVAKNINIVRKRAYGANWAPQYEYATSSDFTANELAILAESDFEFVQEGHRWWDLRRMTLTKGGKHLVFCPEASVDGVNPVLPESQAYKVLWPLDKTLLGSDPDLEQTDGYSN